MPLQLMLRAPTPRRLVSIIYHIYTQRQMHPNQSRTHWDSELGQELSDEQWEYCCSQTEQISASSRLRITHYKFLHRLYYTPSKMYKYRLGTSDCCDRCGTPGADFLHLAWECAPVQEYWEQVLNALALMTIPTIEHSPILALLGYTKSIPNAYHKYVVIALLMAKRRVACR